MLSFVCLCFVATALASSYELWQQELKSSDTVNADTEQMFSSFVQYFHRRYASDDDEYNKRYIIWLSNLQIITNHNDGPLHAFKLRLNQFGDYTRNEYLDYVRKSGSMTPPKDMTSDNNNIHNYDDINAPDAVDWTTKGVVTPIKDQGNCGSCWAFSATGALECRYAILHNGTLNSLSEQQLVSCCGKDYDCYGCGGGFTYEAFKYARDNGGLCSEAEYPYLGHNSGNCDAANCGTKYDANKQYVLLTPDNPTALLNSVSQGCTSISIDADSSEFEYYSSGVLNGNCPSDNLDHAVLVVGYGNDTKTGLEYWKVKNSWGTDWGEAGYIQMCRNCSKNCNPVTGLCAGECGLLSYPLYPTF